MMLDAADMLIRDGSTDGLADDVRRRRLVGREHDDDYGRPHPTE